MHAEICENFVLYSAVFDVHGSDLANMLAHLVNERSPFEKPWWVVVPMMGGEVIANIYQCPVHYFTCVGASMTFLPLTCGVEADKLPICFAFKNGNHFVALEMDENFPAPPVVAYWRRLAYPVA